MANLSNFVSMSKGVKKIQLLFGVLAVLSALTCCMILLSKKNEKSGAFTSTIVINENGIESFDLSAKMNVVCAPPNACYAQVTTKSQNSENKMSSTYEKYFGRGVNPNANYEQRMLEVLPGQKVRVYAYDPAKVKCNDPNKKGYMIHCSP